MMSPRASSARLAAPLALMALLTTAPPAAPDAIVRTTAMLADNIAEIYVTDGQVRVELEIGVGSLEAFADILPREIRQRMGLPEEDSSHRVDRFSRQGLVLEADGLPLALGLESFAAREKIRRDEITGEALSSGALEPELSLFVGLQVPIEGQPESLTIRGDLPARAAIGFVVYHQGVAVNDFRYLSAAQTLELDWQDPWYSRFVQRALNRTYWAPMSGFLYVEPYEVRKEIIVRPKDLQRFVDLGLDGRDTIPVEMQDDVKRKAAEFLRDRQPVIIDGKSLEPQLDQINFLQRTLRTSQVVDPPVELDLDGAILGVIFVYLGDGLPQEATMTWDLWDERIDRVPSSAVDEAGPLLSYLVPDSPQLRWQNFLKNPTLPTLVKVTTPPGTLARAASWLRWPLGLVALVFVSRAAVRVPAGRRAVRFTAAAIAAFVAMALLLVGRGGSLDEPRAREVVSGLLHNVYRAFDYRQEEQIYDILERSVEGELLAQAYLEAQRGLVLANQGGAKVKVKSVTVDEIEPQAGEGGSFRAQTVWTVVGSVGHWGHLHERRNRYRAMLEVVPRSGVWKLAELEILEEERL